MCKETICPIGIILFFLSIAASAWAATIPVTSPDDSGPGTLRQALLDAAANDTIDVNLSNSITVCTQLPVTKPLTIEGHGTTIGAVSSGVSSVFYINAPNILIKNLSVVRGNYGFWFTSSASYSQISGCAIGLDWAGNSLLGNSVGVFIDQSNSNCIGPGNIISCNKNEGINITNGNGNTIIGNLIGITHDQSAALSNSTGIFIQGTYNDIGLAEPGKGNVVSGNSIDAISLNNASNNRIMNNYIGINSAGTKISNGRCGIYLNGSSSNLIGGNRGTNALEKNIISGNHAHGIAISTGDGNTISGNYIGLGLDGNISLGNDGAGVLLYGNHTLIGGPNTDSEHLQGNIISGNAVIGVRVYGDGNVLQGNYIGTNATGYSAVPNSFAGVRIVYAINAIIGGNQPALRNLISGNDYMGILLEENDSTIVIGNYLGVDVEGTSLLANGYTSIDLQAGNVNCKIGGNGTGERNIICGNRGSGVRIWNMVDSSWGNTITGNWIGMMADQKISSPNFDTGIALEDYWTSDNLIGAKYSGQGNTIAGCSNGIIIALSYNNAIFGNMIYGFKNIGISLLGNEYNIGNNNKAAPMITTAYVDSISGTSNANDYIELYQAEPKVGQGGSTLYIGWTMADGSGVWHFNVSRPAGTYVCALATDGNNNTSGFSNNAVIIDPNAIPTQTSTPVVTLTPTPTPTWSNFPGGKSIIYPNPAHDRMRILLKDDSGGQVDVNIYNISGELIAKLVRPSGAISTMLEWNCKDIASGIYIARILQQDRPVETIKIAIVH